MLARMSFAIVASLCLGGCRTPEPPVSLPARPQSARSHIEEGAAHDRMAADDAAQAERAARDESQTGVPIECLDRPLAGITYSGGEPVQVMRPCWTSVTSPSARYRASSARHREEASWHREQATALIEAERAACAGLGELEIATSPFSQREDIARVEAHRVSGRLRGVFVLFRPVPGLTTSWLRRSLRCHYARAAALGFPSDYMASCPAMLPDVRIDVAPTPEGVGVTISSERDEMAAAALGRARDLHRRASR